MEQVHSPDNTFGALFIGTILGAVLYGVSCAQAFYYFQHYSKKDGLVTKAIVISAMIFDTVHQALISHTVYTYLVTYWSQPQMAATLVWSLSYAVLFSLLVALLVQIFYAIRIWNFSQKNKLLTGALSVLIVGQFVTSMIWFGRACHKTMFFDLKDLFSVAITMDTMAAVADVLITIVICILLHRARTNIKRSNTMVNLLIAFSVQTGMLTSICAITAVICIVASPNTFIYGAFYFLLGRLYCNSLLATLNVREAIRERGNNNASISLREFDGSNLSSTANRKDIDIKVEIAHGVETDSEYVKSRTGNGVPSLIPSLSPTENSQAV